MNLTELKLDHLSPSSISTYLDSPLRWYNRYVQGIKDGYSEALHRGIVVHDALEQRFRAEQGDYAVIGPWDWGETVSASDQVKRLENPDAELDLDIPETAGLVAEYWERIGSNLKPIEIEMPFSLELPYGKKFTSLIGRIDLVHDMNGKPALIDFKTGKRKRSYHDVAHDVQAVIYGLALRKLMDVEGDIHFSYHQLIFTTIPQVAILDRPVTTTEMDRFEQDFLPGFVRTLEYQVETDSFFWNPNAKFGTGLDAA